MRTMAGAVYACGGVRRRSPCSGGCRGPPRALQGGAHVARQSASLVCKGQRDDALVHTGWLERFDGRPLDIITASARLTVQGCIRHKEYLVLGSWRGRLLRNSAASGAQISVLMRAVDDVRPSRGRPRTPTIYRVAG